MIHSFTNCRVLHPNGTLSWSSIHVNTKTGRILDIQSDIPHGGHNNRRDNDGTDACAVAPHSNNDKSDCDVASSKEVIVSEKPEKIHDCGGRILSPGFIDIQINGAFGVDFSNANKLTTSGIAMVCHRLPEYGVTSFCPTLVSNQPNAYQSIILVIAQSSFYIKNKSFRQRSSNNDAGDNDNNEKHSHISGANILGIHLEGPFFAPTKRGAHSPKCIRPSLVDTPKTLIDTYGPQMSNILHNNQNSSDNKHQEQCFNNTNNIENVDTNHSIIRIITLAPELPEACAAIHLLSASSSCGDDRSIVTSMGHSNATYEEGVQGIQYGATLITHLFNSMKPFHHREPGLVGVALGMKKGPSMVGEKKHQNKELFTEQQMIRRGSEHPLPYYSIIVDGQHCHESAVNMAYKCNPERLVLITDAMPAMGLQDGRHQKSTRLRLGEMEVVVNDNRATIAGTDVLAGSVASMDQCLRNLKQYTDCAIGYALLAATLHPAQVLKCASERGCISVGAFADLVLLDDELNVMETWVGGKRVFLSPNERKT